MAKIIDVALLEKLGQQDGWAVLDDFIHIFAGTDNLRSLGTGHDSRALCIESVGVVGDSHDEICVWDCVLGLLEESHMPGTSTISEISCGLGKDLAACPMWKRSQTPCT